VLIGGALSFAPCSPLNAQANGPGQNVLHGLSSWSIANVAEITRIVGIAIRDDRTVGFILKEPSVRRGTNRYSLHVTATKGGRDRTLVEAAYLADLQARPRTPQWTVRGDFGRGVQLYDVDAAGRVSGLVVNPEPAHVGGKDGLVTSPDEGSRLTGVLSYGWAQDGSALWYSRLKLPSAAEQRSRNDRGIVFNDVAMSADLDARAPDVALAVELRVRLMKSGSDRLVAAAPGDRATAQTAFQRGSVVWVDQRRLAYTVVKATDDGTRQASRWIVDVDTMRADRLADAGVLEARVAVPSRDGDVVVRDEGEKGRLVALGRNGAVTRDYGRVEFTRMGGNLGYWYDAKSGRAVVGVQYSDHNGLSIIPPESAGAGLESARAHLSDCAFVSDLTVGVCNRESIAVAPELVMVDPFGGTFTVLARPNKRFDNFVALHSVYTRWTNRFGAVNDGYVTYPHDYVAGKPYPAIVVTHGNDAQNRFAYHAFQWEFPIQVFAQRGYVVISVNEPRKGTDAMLAYATGSPRIPVSRMQFEWGYNVVASMEAAAQSLIDQGIADPSRVGIAGYSRGAEVTNLALSQSKLFCAGASGDDAWYSAGSYWNNATSQTIFSALFGGSPLDPAAFPNYLAFSPSARADKYSGPLLQQFSAATADRAIELDFALKSARVPTELVFYRDETHLFHQPRHRVAAMQLSLDWFDYWLLGRTDPDPEKVSQYRRWDSMAKRWSTTYAGHCSIFS
jgi:dipeptidyl aminopeptidase/acylaminoacyl peptidase